jgi:hypothetical protein
MRCLSFQRYVLSLSAAVDGTVGIFRAAARGRISGIALPSATGDSISLYDRYVYAASLVQTSAARPQWMSLNCIARILPRRWPTHGVIDGRYGFLTTSRETESHTSSRTAKLDEIAGKGQSTILSESLPEEQKEALSTRQRDRESHLHAWDRSVNMLINAGDPVILAREDPLIRGLIERGVPDKYRKVVWRALLRSWTPLGKTTPSAQAVVSGMARNEKMTRQIEVDLQRTFPTNKHFEAGGTAIKRLRRVLHRCATPAIWLCV